jgi:voltage-gated potassium channel
VGFLRDPPRAFLLTWDITMVVLALASLVMVVQYDQADDRGKRLLELADYILVGLFALDFAWDLHRAGDRRRFLRRNWWAVLGMVPLAWTNLDYLRLLRLTRAFRILRTFRGLAKVIGRTQTAMERSHVGRLAIVSGSIMLVGSVLVWLVERGANPALATYGEALWWAVVTVTTVGYGDVTPITPLGRLVASALMVTGIGTIGLLAGQVGSHLVGQRDSAPTSVTGELERLAALHRDGHLDDDEFRRAKARVLGGSGRAPDER